MIRFIISLLTLGLVAFGVYTYGKDHPMIRGKIDELLNRGNFHTLEAHYTADHIMETHRKDLLKDSKHVFQEPSYKFYPYLLMEVKFSPTEEKTNEGIILWDRIDGEMVIDTKTWEKTHGFGDMMIAGADRNEFRILSVLSQKGTPVDREGLFKALHVDDDVLDAWLESCRKKQLIVQSGNKYRLHLAHPKLRFIPETRIAERLVTKPSNSAVRLPEQFSASQIEKTAKAAFGQDFAIRKVTNIYLPVISIVVQNPDESVHVSYWNALNGKPLTGSSFLH